MHDVRVHVVVSGRRACDTVLMLRFKIYDKMATIVSIILSHFAIATEFERN